VKHDRTRATARVLSVPPCVSPTGGASNDDTKPYQEQREGGQSQFKSGPRHHTLPLLLTGVRSLVHLSPADDGPLSVRVYLDFATRH
jgi:hypothetical protein